jgi:D-alanyl-D-alanine endopeptidase (penicillin-binding protein 7)
MAAGVFNGRFSSWRRAIALAAAGILLALTALPPASAAPAKKPAAKTADTRKTAPSAKAKTSTAASGKKTASKPRVKTAAAQKTAAAKPAKGKDKGKPAPSAKTTKTAKNNGKSPQLAKTGRAANKQAAARRAKPAGLRKTAHVTRKPAPPPRLSVGQIAGLHSTGDPLDLKSGVALVVDQDTQEVLLRKNDRAVLPIASLTKLMTGLIVSETGLPLDETLTITQDDVDTEKGSRSRLAVGARLTRGELLHLALMSSENRAAHALGRTFPDGGMKRFVALMNARARSIGMADTRYVEPTGLSSANRSSARDLATLVAAAAQDPLLRQLSTSPGYEVAVGDRVLQYHNTNPLVRDPDWHIALQKTGYITEAGRCLVMQTRVAGRQLIMVFLDSSGKHSRVADAERVREWLELRRPAHMAAGGVGVKG